MDTQELVYKYLNGAISDIDDVLAQKEIGVLLLTYVHIRIERLVEELLKVFDKYDKK